MRFAVEKTRDAKRPKGTSGWAARRSATTKPAADPTATTSPPSTRAALASGPLMSSQVVAPSATAPYTVPATSKPPVTETPRLSGTARRVSTTTRTHRGTLMAKSQCQLRWSSTHPPRKGPIAVAMPETPAQVPIARALSSGRKLDWMIASAPGVSSAAPMPWTTRPTTSDSVDQASAQPREARANHTTPTR